MNQYYMDLKKYVDGFNEVAQLNDNLMSQNSYASKTNIDNFPTHEKRTIDPKTGETVVQSYCASSKNFAKVDPRCSDRHSIHYAAEDRTYLILRNKYTGRWEFPTTKIILGTTFFRGKQDLFSRLTKDEWKIKFIGSLPMVHTLRDFTIAEQEDSQNQGMRGVRTYFFGAHHHRGLPEIDFANPENPHDDYLWIPKRQLNEYFTREYHEAFVSALSTR